MWREIKKIIHLHHHFVITTHVNPDGDGIGSACALTELLLQMDKKVRFVCDSPIPSKFAFLDFHGIHEVYHPQTDYSQTQVLIVLDTHRKERIGRLANLAERPGVITLCIDHHPANATFTSINAIDVKACSVGAMVYTLYKECGFELNIEAATGIYASVLCDTGRFSYSSTNRKSHKIADECIKLGVDPDRMYTNLFQHVPLAQVKMFARALERMEAHLDNRVIIEQISREDYPHENNEAIDLENLDLDYIHEFNKLIENVDCVVLLRELPGNHVRVSMRSMSDLDISQIMKALGGGGHSKAAGVTWTGSVTEVKEKILELLKDALHVSHA